MKALLQRVTQASVTVDGQVVGAIDVGILVLLGIEKGDAPATIIAQAEKLLRFRIFPDETGKMNRSVQDIQGGLLVVSQFTLAADCRKGNRPGFDRAMPPDIARELVDLYVETLRKSGLKIETGVFGASMAVALVNDGPVTFLLEAPPAQQDSGLQETAENIPVT